MAPARNPPPLTVTVPQAPEPIGSPSDLRATVAGSTASFTSNPPPTGGPATGYVLWAGLTPSVTPPLATISLVTATSHVVVTGVPPGTYYVFVQARNAFSASAASNVVTVTVAGATPPGAPTLLPPTLSWNLGPGGVPTSYTLFARSSPTSPPLVTVPLTGSGTSFTNVPVGTYYLELTASNAGGTSPASPAVVVAVR
jgi:hypothetical protein